MPALRFAIRQLLKSQRLTLLPVQTEEGCDFIGRAIRTLGSCSMVFGMNTNCRTDILLVTEPPWGPACGFDTDR
jgi:hypothetical protein